MDPRVLAAMRPWLGDGWGNAHSIHEPGRRARAAVEGARASIAQLLSCQPEEVFFTSGATESSNWVIRAHESGAFSPFEHEAVRQPALRAGYAILPNAGYELRPVPSREELISVMAVNNEVGTIFDVASFRSPADVLHSDITQALGKIATDLTPLDYASFSAHKLYGPQGVGGLFAREGSTPEPLLLGGEQEHGRRAGTLNVAAIVGMGMAAQVASDERIRDQELASELREICLEELRGVPDLMVHGGSDVSPFILSLSLLGVEGETLVVEMDAAGYAISAGAACSSTSTEPSHVLTALGLDSSWIRGTIRISFGRFNTLEATAAMANHLRTVAEKIRRKA